ncbi:hypothetical protein [Nonomuraea sediminis]|uniref:hypothetical protein n=1 Tax=Nonomuraea sediminis TaxID=2835864 RepID=UPI001BDD4648|nr:hypothetical protein [Nonomuraea sediminis]
MSVGFSRPVPARVVTVTRVLIALPLLLTALQGAAAASTPHSTVPSAAVAARPVGNGGGGPVPGPRGAVPKIQQPLSDVEPKAAPTRPVRPGAVSAASRQIAQFGPMTVPAGEVWRQWVYCPSGMRAVNGGESNTSPGGIQLIHTGPYTPSSDAGWIVNVRNLSGSDARMTVYAVCDSNVSDYLFTEGPHRTAEPGVYVAAIATCTDGRKAVGGGFWPVPNTVNAPALAPSEDGSVWANYVRNTGVENVDVWPYAVCVRGTGPYQVVSGALHTFRVGQFASVTAPCPQGWRLIGGGVLQPHNTPVGAVTDNYPDSANSWTAWVRNDSPYETQVQAIAFCTL